MQVTKEEYVAFLRTMKILEAFANDDLMQTNVRRYAASVRGALGSLVELCEVEEDKDGEECA